MIPDVFPFKEKTSGIGQVEPQNNNKMMENFEFEEKFNPWNIESLEDKIFIFIVVLNVTFGI